MSIRRLLLVPVLVGALLAAFAAPARADTGVITGTGTDATTFTSFNVVRQAAGNSFWTSTAVSTETGFENSTCNDSMAGVFHADGSGNFSGASTCTGTIAGQAGTYQLRLHGTIAADGSFIAQEVITGVGSLAGLHGVRTVVGPAGGGIATYTDTLTFS